MTLLRKSWIILITAIITSSCATEYHPVGDYGGIPSGGYADTRINANTVVVSFSGNPFTPQKSAMTYLLYRCAKVTLENGYDYFVLTSNTLSPINVNVKTRTDYNQYITDPPRFYTAYYQSTQYESYQNSKTRTGCYNQGARCHPELHSLTAVIKMFNGDIPPGLPNAYNAEDVIAHLGPATL